MALLTAVLFLTRIPIPYTRPIEDAELGRSVAFFPVVGLLLGLTLALLNLLFSPFLASQLVDVLLIAAMIALTGALHLDGFMDSCDGLFSMASPERRLEIMRDSQVGAFGVAGAGVLLILKYAALQSLGSEHKGVMLMVAMVLSRWAMAYAIRRYPYARAEGAGNAFKKWSGARELAAATATAAIVGVALAGLPGILGLATAYVVAKAAASYAVAKIGGLTGDVYGFINEIVEITLLILLPIYYGWFNGIGWLIVWG